MICEGCYGNFPVLYDQAAKRCSECWPAYASQRIATLTSAIVKHRSQKADDRCIEDDDELYAVLGDGIKCDRRVGDKEAMLANCGRFIERRCEGGGWLSYVELEAQLAATREALFMPGESRCPLCGFRLHKRILSASTGSIGIDNSIQLEPCPNDGQLLERVTWQQEAEENGRVAMDAMKELLLTRKRLDELEPAH